MNAFSTSRNYQTQQQSMFLAILNNYYDIMIEIPKKKSIVSLPFLKVIKFENENEQIKINDEVNTILKNLYDTDIKNGVSDKTATRRFEINRITENIKIMMNLCVQKGFMFHTYDIGKKRTRENIQKIVFDGVEWEMEDIINKGSMISNVIVKERMTQNIENGWYTLNKQDMEIMSILFR